VLVVCVLLVFGAYAASIYRHNMAETDRIWAHTRDELMMAYQAKVAFESQQTAWTNLILRGHETKKYHEYLSEFYARERETRHAINALISIHGEASHHDDEPSSPHVNAAQKFQQDYAGLGRQYREALKIYNASDDPTFEADRFIWEAVDNPSNMKDIMIEQIVSHHRHEIELVNAIVDTELTRLWISAALVLLLSMAGLVWFIDKRNGQTVYRVTDNGVGSNMDYTHKLFGPFERLHTVDEFEGTGIGSASVQRAIQRHGGWIRGECEPGKGTEFIFSLG